MTLSASVREYDPIALEIQWQRLIAIMDEIDNATVRTSFSTIVGESRDFACILLDADGSSLCQSSWSPPDFCVIIPRTTRDILARFPVDTLQEGDVLVTNDPWLGTGHLPDYIVVTPVFNQGKVVAFMGTIAHLSDVGGHIGDIESPDVFTEGIRVTPAKFFEAGQPNALLHEIIGNNCRVPDMVLGDLHAIVGTHWIGAKRIQEFLDDYGMDDLVTLSDVIHTRSEEVMRRGIEALPDGVYTYGLDIDGYIDPVHLHVTVEVRGSDIYIDYTGTSGQTKKASINCTFNTTYAVSIYPFKCALAASIPNNEGLFRPIHIAAPEGCILNCTFPSPVKARAKTTNNVNQVLFGAVWPILGEHAQAGAGSIWPFHFSGVEDGYGRFKVHMLPHGGRGAMADMDGSIPVAFPHNSTVTPTEIMETEAPILMWRKEYRPDSVGAGRRRGGTGQIITVESIARNPMTLSLRPDKIVFNPPGLNQGRPGKLGEVYLNGQRLTRFPPIQFNPGDVVELHIPGGGGFGDPALREPERVREDVERGYITPEFAREVYGVEV